MANGLPKATSVWMETTEVTPAAHLDRDIKTDVRIVGAGIAGMTTAYLLTRHGKSVVVLDDGAIGGGMTHGKARASGKGPVEPDEYRATDERWRQR